MDYATFGNEREPIPRSGPRGRLPGHFPAPYGWTTLRAVAPLSDLPFPTRFFLAFSCFFRVLFDGAFAARVFAVQDGMPEPKVLPPAPEPKPEPKSEPKPEPKHTPDAALSLLALLQREGRLVDFLLEDVEGAADADIGAAARVVHSGCRKALKDHVELAPIHPADEGTKVTLPAGFDAKTTKLTGNVAGDGPYEGTLKHRGWKATAVKLPHAVEGHDATVVAQAEVEL